MVSTTVMTRPPGSTVRWVLSETRLFAVTVIDTKEPLDASDPADGDTVTLVVALSIEKSTGPPSAFSRNVPLTAVSLAAVSVSLTGSASSVPGVDGAEDDGEGDGD